MKKRFGKNCHVIILSLVFCIILFLSSAVSAVTYAGQIKPNPNPSGETITVTDANSNAESFDNYGTIQIESTGTLENSDWLYNWHEIKSSGIINNTMMIQIPILALLFLGEHITWQEGLGMVLAGIGIVIVQLRR